MTRSMFLSVYRQFAAPWFPLVITSDWVFLDRRVRFFCRRFESVQESSSYKFITYSKTYIVNQKKYCTSKEHCRQLSQRLCDPFTFCRLMMPCSSGLFVGALVGIARYSFSWRTSGSRYDFRPPHPIKEPVGPFFKEGTAAAR